MEPMSQEQISRFCQLAHERIALGNYAGARPYLAAASDATDAPPPMLLRLQGVCAAGLENFAEALPLLEAALDGFRLAEDVQGEVMVAGDLASVLQRHGNLGRADALITWAIDHVGCDNPVQRMWLLNIAASVATLQGRLDAALDYLEAARPLADAQFSAWVDLHLAATFDQLKRHDQAAAHLDAAQQPRVAGDVISKPLLAYAHTWHALLQADFATAYATCQEALHHTALDDQPLLGGATQATLGVLARELGDFERAEAVLVEAATTMQQHGDYAALLGIHWHQALLASQRGEGQAALSQLNGVLDQMQAGGYGTTLLWQPQRFAELCEWACAEGLRHPHLDWLLEHVLAPWCSAAPGTDAPSPAALTTREQQIVAALAQELTDREIAAQLRISERTVQNHLQHIYAKLGVRKRAAVVGVVMAQEAGG